MEVNITCPQLKEGIDLMRRYPEMINANIKDIFKVALADIERSAKMLAPVDTGRLRTDIGTRFNERELEGIIYNDVEYAIYVHDGTGKMKGRPYLLDAIRGKAPDIARRMERDALKERRGLI